MSWRAEREGPRGHAQAGTLPEEQLLNEQAYCRAVEICIEVNYGL